MLEIAASNRFRKDLKLAIRRGCDMAALEEVIKKLASREPLLEKSHDHDLNGDYVGFRECHIAPDWLLVYKVENDELLLYFFRTGTHSDLF